MKWKTEKGAYHQLVSLWLSSSSSSLLLRSSFVYTCTSICPVLIAENNRKIEQRKTYTTTLQNRSKQWAESSHSTVHTIHLSTYIYAHPSCRCYRCCYCSAVLTKTLIRVFVSTSLLFHSLSLALSLSLHRQYCYNDELMRVLCPRNAALFVHHVFRIHKNHRRT